MLAIGLEEGRVEVLVIIIVIVVVLAIIIIKRSSLSVSPLQVMHLKLEYRTEDDESCERELERFLHYVSII